jgi:putative flippase GtrA
MVLKTKHFTWPTWVLPYLPLFFQLLRFGLVGVSAALVHFTLVVLMVELHWLQPLVANVAAFGFAFQVSYWGHRRFTFSGTRQRHGVAFPRLLLVSILAFMANESMFYILMAEFDLPYTLALILVLSILPLVVFTANKLWVFELSGKAE